jgi:hypothetical protein
MIAELPVRHRVSPSRVHPGVALIREREVSPLASSALEGGAGLLESGKRSVANSMKL